MFLKLEDCCCICSTEFIKIVCTAVFKKPDILNRISHMYRNGILFMFFKNTIHTAFIRPSYSSRRIMLCNAIVHYAIKTHIFNIQPSVYIDCIVYTLWLFVNCNFLHYITPAALVIIIIIITTIIQTKGNRLNYGVLGYNILLQIIS